MKDVMFLAALIACFVIFKLFSDWCEKQITKNQ